MIEGDRVRDISVVLDQLPTLRWPIPAGDMLIRELPNLQDEMARARDGAPSYPLDDVQLLSPIANPSKIIAAPLNYHAHVSESAADAAIHNGVHLPGYDGFSSPVDKFGVFLKSTTSVVGAGEGVRIAFPGRRNDHEVELAVVIGKQCKNVVANDAAHVIAGYCIGLDMTVRGTEDRSYRKSADTYTVLGPCLVTRDEIHDPNALDMSLLVNGAPRQQANTRDLITGIDELVAIASRLYTLYPGDVILTGTPEGVASIEPGDLMTATIEQIGSMHVRILG
ncbi:fumarylacetoacetate hydrolase family protein [Variovorax sp. UC122_21]